MPSLFVEIPDHANTIRRTSMFSVIVSVIEQLGLDKDYIQFSDGHDNKAQPGSTIGPTNDVKFGSEQRINVEMNDQRDNFNLVDRGLGYKFQIPIFHDPINGVRITPAHARHNVTATITSRFPSRGLATEWVNSMHRRTAMFGDVFEVEATFHYMVPTEAITVIKMMYLTGARKVAPTQTLEEYMDQYAHDNLTYTTTDTATAKSWTVRNTLGRIIVVMDGLGEVTPVKEDDTGAWNAEISYTYQIDWPEGVKIDYPCMVNNSLIPESLWHCRELPGTVDIGSYEVQDMIYAQDKLTTHYEVTPLPVVMPPVGYPMLQPAYGSNTAVELVVVFLEFGAELPEVTPPEELATDYDKWICNLGDLGNVDLQPETLAYIKDSYAVNTDGRDSLFKIVAYDFTLPLEGRIHVDQNLDVWLKDTEIDLTQEYRMAMLMELDMSRLTPLGRTVLKRNIPWMLVFIKEFFPEYTKGWPWLFPGVLYQDNIAGGGLYPVFTAGTPVLPNSGGGNSKPPYWGQDETDTGDITPNPFWPTTPPWNGEGPSPVWPDDYVNWWEDDDLINGKPIINPDGSVDVENNPDHPCWDWIIDELSRNSKEYKVTVTIHRGTIIAQRRG